ncbi:urea ABC transporter permease subunit UrtB [Actibacterium sp. XHP0104]|nr:urea ABC transporter permease subunit UrtB [Actibacterium sp. XHP0104]MCV2880578.1 urea ABC transporter permease subunit UrtB [Actibacterium sp. XHP0104]
MMTALVALAQTPIQDLLQTYQTEVAKPSRKSIDTVVDALIASGLPETRQVLFKWQNKDLFQRNEDGLFFFAEDAGNDSYRLIDIATGQSVGEYDRKAVTQLKPNAGVRGVIANALVQFQLTDPDPIKRARGLQAIERNAEPSHLKALRASIDGEDDPTLLARKQRLERILTISYDTDSAARVAAIESFSTDLGVDARAALNPLLATTRKAAPGLPQGQNVAKTLKPGSDDLSRSAAYDLLVEARLAPPLVPLSEQKAALIANIENGQVGGIKLRQLDNDAARARAYATLAGQGLAPPTVTEADIDAALARHVFYDLYTEPDSAVTDAAEKALTSIKTRVGLNQALDLALDGLSLASIYFLAAIGLAITFGVMGVINMAHGEFIMMGAYTGYVVQQFIPNYTVSIIVALPLAFAVTFAAGVAMERLVIRWLYNRPLETLLATFGISIALQQIAKNIFGTQARPLTSPGWLDGALVLNDVVSISYIRIAIFGLSLIFLVLLLFVLNKTRLGLETRAVTQNPRMAASMGINPDKVNMLTFGLGSGIAGIAGVAIGLYAKVTSELGADYIVQSFMTVVVGGVGNIWGTLLGATMIGFLQKGIEWLNPSNTLAAQTYMIIFIIIFIQFRPKGIIALKGRAAGD